MLQPFVSGICKRRLFFCACFFNLLLASATRLAMAGFRGDTEDAMEVPPDDFLDSLEAINIRWRNYQRTLFSSILQSCSTVHSKLKCVVTFS